MLIYLPEVFHADIFAEDIRQPVFLYDLFDHEPCADPQAAAPRAPVLHLRDILIREVFEVVLVRLHLRRISVGFLPDSSSFGVCFLRRLIINTVVFIVDIVHSVFSAVGDLARRIGYIYQKSPFIGVFTPINIVTQNPYLCNTNRINTGFSWRQPSFRCKIYWKFTI